MPKLFNAKKIALKLGVLTLVAVCGGPAESSSNPPLYTLDWAAKGERLTYRSCGCADSCWVAELRIRNSKGLRARLRCDCDSLYVTFPANGPERQYAESCSVTNDAPDKMAAISKEVKRIVEGNRSK
jgi:hypothetical protein